VVRAIGIGEYLVAHARAAFAVMGADPATEDAKVVLAAILRDGRERLTRRDVYRHVHSRVGKVVELDPALRILVDRGYLREVPVEAHKKGRPSPSYDVNPRAR
jgi:hypothetical protein